MRQESMAGGNSGEIGAPARKTAKPTRAASNVSQSTPANTRYNSAAGAGNALLSMGCCITAPLEQPIEGGNDTHLLVLFGENLGRMVKSRRKGAVVGRVVE